MIKKVLIKDKKKKKINIKKRGGCGSPLKEQYLLNIADHPGGSHLNQAPPIHP